MKLKSLNKILDFNNLDMQFNELKRDIQNGDTLCVLPGRGDRIHIASALNRPVIYVAKDSYSAIFLYKQLQAYNGDEVCLFQPNDDLLLFKKSYQRSYTGDRIKSLYKFAKGECKILVTSPMALMQFVPDKNKILQSVLSIHVLDEYDLYEFIDKLVFLGYEREDVCEEKNTFSVHGDIVDIFLPYMDSPVRISFFDNVIENIKTFDIESLLSIKEIENIEIYPNNDLLFDKEKIEEGILKAKKETLKMPIDAATRCDQIINEIELVSSCTQNAQWLIPFLRSYSNTLFDYIKKDGVLVLDEPESILAILKNYEKETIERVKDLSKSGEVTIVHTKCILSFDEFLPLVKDTKKLAFTNMVSSNVLINPKSIRKIHSVRLNNYFLHYDILQTDLKNFVLSGFMVLLCQPTKDRAKTLADSLSKEDIPCGFIEGEAEFKVGIYSVCEDILDGFNYPKSKIVVIGADNIAKKTSDVHSQQKKRNVFVMPKVGDYVVHEVHGIGKCLGLKRVKTGNNEQDYIIVEYKNGGLLYVPSNQIDRLSRYSGSDKVPTLSLIGGKDFGVLKNKVKKSLKKMAIDLVDIYSARMNKKGYKYSEDDDLMQEFESSFEFEPTPDQIEAIKDIKADMEKGVIMDRLLCGDVGYGKTEVALRAIFKTVLNGKQAAFLVPTTILAQQHYDTAKDRFNAFGIGVELVCRLKSKNDIKKSLDRIKTNQSQVLIATHRMLSKDVEFFDLGLLVLDEEQRFGVEHKEKLKIFKNTLNVLTLSATPIPRTLNMSLIGVRDISVLETPPINRIPIQTAVTELSSALLEDTIKRELSRDGQVFILYNHVSSISRFASDVQAIVPEAKVIYAHGQMSSEDLEDRIQKFYSKEANVLVCTTIIENGIDIPDANTLIVCDADKLGLSQLYQLRGRVGRSNKMAYAYFTVEPSNVLTSNALKRLNAIMDYTELGSGFKVAMRDLEIRGAGNILGKEQHGHIEKIGYDLYCKLLQENINELKGLKNMNITCQVDADINAYLDKDYVSEDNSRIKIFRDIIDVKTNEDVDSLLSKLKDSFGEVPLPLVNLVKIGYVKNLAQECGIENITIKGKITSITVESANVFSDEKFMMTIAQFNDKLSITNEDKPKIVFNLGVMDNVKKLDFIAEFLNNAVTKI